MSLFSNEVENPVLLSIRDPLVFSVALHNSKSRDLQRAER